MIPEITLRDRGKLLKGQDRPCTGRYSNRAPPEYKWVTLLPKQICSVIGCIGFDNWYLNRLRYDDFSSILVVKSIIFWDVTPCSLLSCNRRFGGTYRLHLQARRNNFSKNQQVSRNGSFGRTSCHRTVEVSPQAILYLMTYLTFQPLLLSS
jgi:hypothetical protein